MYMMMTMTGEEEKKGLLLLLDLTDYAFTWDPSSSSYIIQQFFM